ncbi:MafI family immunity protein [Desulfosarcina sp. OttesenSCG-928-A07]|nr:MafI family immunity protein [Desulfosarcina sp. OttesenSCG-928-A07]
MTEKSHYQKLEILFEALCEDLASLLPASELAEVVEYLDHGEYGIALEDLCFIIEEAKRPITQKIYGLIEQLGILMEMKKDVWKNLEAFIGE